jgi:acyl carrier protein
MAIMASAFEVPAVTINERTSQETLPNWDSLHHVKLIVLLERAFNINIPDERVGNMISFKIIKEVINECIGT